MSKDDMTCFTRRTLQQKPSFVWKGADKQWTWACSNSLWQQGITLKLLQGDNGTSHIIHLSTRLKRLSLLELKCTFWEPRESCVTSQLTTVCVRVCVCVGWWVIQLRLRQQASLWSQVSAKWGNIEAQTSLNTPLMQLSQSPSSKSNCVFIWSHLEFTSSCLYEIMQT